MTQEIYILFLLAATILGIILGSYLNSKLLTRTWKGEINQAKEEMKESEEYKIAMELINNLNKLLDSEQAKNFLQNMTNMIEQLLYSSANQDVRPPPPDGTGGMGERD